jgi:hypothetical protein
MALVALGIPIPGKNQAITTSASSQAATAFPPGTVAVRVTCITNPCFISFGVGTTATSADAYLPVGTTEYFPASPNGTLSVLQSGGAGTLYVHPCA